MLQHLQIRTSTNRFLPIACDLVYWFTVCFFDIKKTKPKSARKLGIKASKTSQNPRLKEKKDQWMCANADVATGLELNYSVTYCDIYKSAHPKSVFYPQPLNP